MDDFEDLPLTIQASSYPRSPLSKRTQKQLKDLEIESLPLCRTYLFLAMFTALLLALSLGIAYYVSKQEGLLTKTILRPELDNRNYKAIILSNDLRVLLISDPDSDQSAASMTINIGSYSDPNYLPGIAHLTEHMFLKGSKKYEKSNEFEDFVRRNGGEIQSFTENLYTIFSFEIDDKNFATGLDIFSRYFIESKMNEDCFEKEIANINLEYAKKIKDKNLKNKFILKLIADFKHPFSRFDIGNNDTLLKKKKNDTIDVYQEMINFQKRHYSANLMSLTIIGSKSIEILEEWAKNKFGLIKNNKVEIKDFGIPFKINNLGLFCKIYNENKMDKLNFVFTIDNKVINKNSIDYLDYIFKFEGEKSFLSNLRKNQLVLNIQTEITEKSNEFILYSIMFTLQKKEYENIIKIIEFFFIYIKTIQENGFEEQLYKDLGKISKIAFRFHEKEKILKEAQIFSKNLVIYQIHNVLSGNQIFKEFDKKEISILLNYFKINNCIFIHESDNYIYSKEKKQFKNFEDFYKDNFIYNYSKIYNLTYDYINLQNSFLLQFKSRNIMEIQFSIPNQYIPEDLSIIPQCNSQLNIFKSYNKSNSTQNSLFQLNFLEISNYTESECTQFDISNDLAQDYPLLIYNTNKGVFYFKMDRSFQLPKIISYFSFESPLTSLDTKQFLLTVILTNFLKIKVNMTFFDAINTGYEINFDSTMKGLILKISGFSDKFYKLLNEVINLIKYENIDENLFKQIKSQINLNFLNSIDLMKKAKLYIQKLIRKKFFAIEDLKNMLNETSIEEIIVFKKHFLQKYLLRGLFIGNILNSTALLYTQNIINKLNYSEILIDEEIYSEKLLNISRRSFIFNIETDNSLNEINSVCNYYQYGVKTIENFTNLIIIADSLEIFALDFLKINIYNERFEIHIFNEAGIMGLFIYCSKKNFTNLEINEKIENLLLKFENFLNSYSDEEFQNIKINTAFLFKDKEKNLLQKANRYWKEIFYESYEFNQKEKMRTVLKELNLNKLIEFYKDFFKNKAGKISIFFQNNDQNIGNNSYTGLKNENIDFEKWKKIDLERFSN